MRAQKRAFVANNPGYGYITAYSEPERDRGNPQRDDDAPLQVDAIRRADFPLLLPPLADGQLEETVEKIAKGLVYLDHAGATLYGASQLRAAMEPLLNHVHGNPHSQGPVSSVTAARTDAARLAVLRFFGAHPRKYSVVFTSGATAALKLVGECFPWQNNETPREPYPPKRQNGVRATERSDLQSEDVVLNDKARANQEESPEKGSAADAAAVRSCLEEDLPSLEGSIFVHARNSHNSVLGIREYAAAAGAAVASVDLGLIGNPASAAGASFVQNKSSMARASSITEGGNGSEDSDDGISESDGETETGKSYSAAVGRVKSENGSNGSVRRETGASARGGGSSFSGSGGGGMHNAHATFCACGARLTSVSDCLFAFPAECNATGERHDLSLVSRVKKRGMEALAPAIVSRNNAQRAGAFDAALERCAVCKSRRGRRRRWYVLLDAAKFVATAPLDLSEHPADFVVVSFYKIFGYPSGLGALIVRNSAARRLRKRYFGGGTVLAALADAPFYTPRTEPERALADGTENFLGILALQAGFDVVSSLGGISAISAHVTALGHHLYKCLANLRHANGAPVCKIFGAWSALNEESISGKAKKSETLESSDGIEPQAAAASSSETQLTGCAEGPFAPLQNGAGAAATAAAAAAATTKASAAAVGRSEQIKRAPADSREIAFKQGPVVTFRVLRPNGEAIGHAEAEKLAGLHNIQLRTGCFCNPGACQQALGLSDAEILENLEAGHVCWDDNDLVNGRPTGLIRVSLGWMSTFEDVEFFLRFVAEQLAAPAELSAGPCARAGESRADEGGASEDSVGVSRPKRPTLEEIYVYPIKSCAAQRARNGWPVGQLGLLHDREWAIADAKGRALRLKQAPAMCHIRPHVDLAAGTLTVSAVGMDDLVLPLDWGAQATPQNPSKINHGQTLTAELLEREEDQRACVVRVCGVRCRAVEYGASASKWFSEYLGLPCSLVRAVTTREKTALSGDGNGCSSGAAKALGVSDSALLNSGTAAFAAATGSAALHGSPPAAASDAGALVDVSIKQDVSLRENSSESAANGQLDASGAASQSTGLLAALSIVGSSVGRLLWSGSSSSASAGGDLQKAKAREDQVFGASAVDLTAPANSDDASIASGSTNGRKRQSGSKEDSEPARAFSNEAQYLLISKASVDRVNEVIRRECADEGCDGPKEVGPQHFRPNFVVGGTVAHEDDLWRGVRIGPVSFEVTGPCSRCAMINIDPETGDPGGVALRVLASYRRERANVLFGQFLSLQKEKETELNAENSGAFPGGIGATSETRKSDLTENGRKNEQISGIAAGSDANGAYNERRSVGNGGGGGGKELEGGNGYLGVNAVSNVGSKGLRWLYEGALVVPQLRQRHRHDGSGGSGSGSGSGSSSGSGGGSSSGSGGESHVA